MADKRGPSLLVTCLRRTRKRALDEITRQALDKDEELDAAMDDYANLRFALEKDEEKDAALDDYDALRLTAMDTTRLATTSLATALVLEATEGVPEKLTPSEEGDVAAAPVLEATDGAPVERTLFSPLHGSLRPSLAWSLRRSRRAVEKEEADAAATMAANGNHHAEPGPWPSGSENLRIAWAGTLGTLYVGPLSPLVPATVTAAGTAAAQKDAEAMASDTLCLAEPAPLAAKEKECAASETALTPPAAAAAAAQHDAAMVDCAAGETQPAYGFLMLATTEAVALAEAETLRAEDTFLVPAAAAAEGLALPDAETLRLADDVADGEEECDASDVAEGEEETLPDLMPRWRKEEFGEAKAAHMMVEGNSYTTWVRCEKRLGLMRVMPAHELKRRRLSRPPACV